MQQVFGDTAQKKSAVYDSFSQKKSAVYVSFSRFKNEQETLEVDQRSGRSSPARTEEIIAKVRPMIPSD
jgi:PHD/YefM family antitoxin component YafN of YafNO toxin-antitoxin module